MLSKHKISNYGFAILRSFSKRRACALFFLLFMSITGLLSQQAVEDSLLTLRFIKAEVEMEKPGSLFNVLEIRNNRPEKLSGVLVFNFPDSWGFIGAEVDSVSLDAGEGRLIPVRISMPGNTFGGVSFVLGAELFAEDFYDYANAYISIKRVSKWDMHLSTDQLYLSEYKPVSEVDVSLKNTGNSNEMIKLSFDLGGMLEFRDKLEADSFLYVEVPANTDTSIKLHIQSRSDLSYAEKQALKNSWKAQNIDIVASTTEQLTSGSVRTTSLESKTINRLPIQNTPLNAEMTFYNLGSQQRVKSSLRVFGKVLFPEDQQFAYSLGYYNLYFDPEMNKNLNLYDQLRFMAQYTDPSTMVLLSDRIGAGVLHTLSGRGIRASHEINERNQMGLHVVQNPYGKNIGGFVGYAGMLGNVDWNTGVTLETSTEQLYSHYTLHLGGGYQFWQKHSFNLQTATTVSNFKHEMFLADDTTVVGFAYQLRYRFSGRRLKLNLENNNTMYTYMRNSGMNRINFTGDYRFKEGLYMNARYYRNSYTTTRYPLNFIYTPSKNLNDNARLLLAFNKGKVIYQVGPQYFGTVRNSLNSSGTYRTRFTNYQPGVMGSVSFRMGNQRSLTPNASFNMMFYNYEEYRPGLEASNSDSKWTYTLGINYYDRAFKLNAYYTSGESADIYRTVVVSDDPVINQAFHIRPYYERYFFKEVLRLSAYLNYSYYMPSMRENLLFNFTGTVRVKETWNIFTSVNVYRVTRRDLEVGKITNRDLNVILGVRKSFDIQQPRLGFYDLSIIGFNDLNGDGVKSDDEKPISNVLVRLSRDPDLNVEKRSGFAETGMITDPTGEIFYENIPMGVYNLSILSLSNLENLYFLNGTSQTIEINDDMVYYMPLVESYKIKGRIIIDRDPNSNEGKVSPEGIRVTAVSETGETYAALTSSFGTYVLDLPKASAYEVSIYNVFGENFRLERGSYKVQFTENKTINLDFKFIEQRRAIQFQEGEQLFQFNLGNGNR